MVLQTKKLWSFSCFGGFSGYLSFGDQNFHKNSSYFIFVSTNSGLYDCVFVSEFLLVLGFFLLN